MLNIFVGMGVEFVLKIFCDWLNSAIDGMNVVCIVVIMFKHSK